MYIYIYIYIYTFLLRGGEEDSLTIENMGASQGAELALRGFVGLAFAFG